LAPRLAPQLSGVSVTVYNRHASVSPAEHVSYPLLGPASLSLPGYRAQPGETIVLYAVGFGLPDASAPLINGSSSQSGAPAVSPAGDLLTVHH
jgi:hypothetical protein